LREATRAKLDQRQRREAWLFAGMLALGIAVFGALQWPGGATKQSVQGVVRHTAVEVNPETGQRSLHLQVELAGGRLVNASGPWHVPPKVHDTVRLSETTSIIGFRTYYWNGPERR
jgi:hypothetical protein